MGRDMEVDSGREFVWSGRPELENLALQFHMEESSARFFRRTEAKLRAFRVFYLS